MKIMDLSRITCDRPRTIFLEFSWARCSCLILLLTLAPLVEAKAATTVDRVLYEQGFLQVVSPDRATAEQARALAKKVLAAWKFDLSVMHWANLNEMQKLLTLRLVSDARMNEGHHGRAYSLANGTFVVRMSLIGDPSIDLTFAHELGHIQAYRAFRGRAVPHYFIEGHGLMMNVLYADQLRQDRRAAGAAQGRVMMALTPEEVRTILTDEEKSKREPNMEVAGLFFVEYLRVRKNIPDAVPRMGRVFELVGRGRTYEQAFGQTYGLSLKQAVSEIVAYLKRTEARPAERIRGTRFEEYLPARRDSTSREGRGANDQ